MNMRFVQNEKSGDPSNRKQIFTNINLKILCFRYWALNLWDCYDMVFPYWRIYWNKNEGGELGYNDNVQEMDSNFVYLIPPFTSFFTKFNKKHVYTSGINVLGKVISELDDELEIGKHSLIHLFMHFNLGVPFDNVYPGIYKIKLVKEQRKNLNKITSSLKIEGTNFSLKFNLKIQSFILEILSNLETELWNTINIDNRVLKILRFIEVNLNENLSNDFMAEQVNMASNSFARLFKNEMNITLHSFIQKRKIARACELFDHSNKTIEEVAFQFGFSDRYHFSRVFKSITGMPPASYRSQQFSA